MINPRTVWPLIEGEAEFATLKGDVDRMQRPTTAQVTWTPRRPVDWQIDEQHFREKEGTA